MVHSARSAAYFVLGALSVTACTRHEAPPSPATSGSPTINAANARETKQSISIKGSDTMVLLGQRWAESYMKENQGVTVQVTGGGSGTGIAALIQGSTDICEASRPMKEKEKADLKSKRNGAEAIETKVALDALAVYVNAKNPLKEIAIPDLGKIYMGEIKNWKEIGGKDHAIILYGRESNSGTYGYFKEHVLDNKDFAAATQTLAGTSAVANAVKGDEFGIGYGGIAYLEGVHALGIKKDAKTVAVMPTLQTAQDGSYPISRFLYFYTAGEPKDSSKTFIQWVRGEPGQKVIGDVGYYPLPKG